MRKKLIEVALPLEAINAESAREKSIRHGHPSTLHLWWARRPLAACRAVLWASLVDDPSSWPEKFPTEAEQTKERQRLFDILGRITIETDKKGNQKQVVRGLVSWDDIKDEQTINEAQREIARCLAWSRGEEPPTKPEAVRDYIAQHAPPVYDPFAGGGSIPLEAQRLGLEAHASDLNPVAVLINKALIEIPPRFKDCPPVNPDDRQRGKLESWKGAQGLAADVRYYGQWMRDEAFQRIGHLYPPHPLAPSPQGEGGQENVGTSRSPSSQGEGGQDSSSTSAHSSQGEGGQLPSPSLGEGLGVRVKQRMTEIARKLRKEQTKSEEILWQALRNRKLDGRKFRRQHPIAPFVVDFFCAEENLIVEVDGSVHDSPEQQALDRERQSLLESLGLRFVRLRAEAVESNLSECLNTIQSALSPLSLTGRGAGGEGANSLTGRGAGGEGANSLTGKGGKATVIAWIWARSVRCPNPACGCQMPLVRSFQLSKKKGRTAWVEPIVYVERSRDVENDGDTEETKIRFEVKTGEGEIPEGTVQRKGARCLACETPVGLDYVRSEGKAKRMSQQLMAVVAESKQGRVYLSPTVEQERIAFSAQPEWKPDSNLPEQALGFRVQNYGMTKHSDLFTDRQLVALTTFSDLVTEVREKVIQDAIDAGLSNDDIALEDGGTGVNAYAEAVGTYLAFAIDKCTDYWNSIATWASSGEFIRNCFARQAIPMTWDFVEGNSFSDSTGNFTGAIDWIIKVLEQLPEHHQETSQQHDAKLNHPTDSIPKLISTDPPYYDAVPYADLSDFFYVWLRRSLISIYPTIFRQILTPKSEEMVADHFRYSSKEKAKEFFESSLIKVFHRTNKVNHTDYPVTIYYALKQIEIDDKNNAASTGWETILEGLMQANYSIGGTWPLRTERSGRLRDNGSNALASSIVLVCRPRPETATQTTRRQFLSELKRELPKALKTLQQGNIAPVDLAQASIGPGMAIYSQYTAVLENDGSPMPVRTALQLINQILDEFLTEQEGEFDGDTRWALTWFEQYQFNAGQYGDAETLSKAKNTSVQGMVEAGIIEAKAGKVRLLKREELPTDWTPDTDTRMPDWELTQYLIRELLNNGEMGAAELLSKLGDRGEGTRDLAYRLYSLCERKNWAQDAIAYNSLVTAWPEITRLAIEFQSQTSQQTTLDF